MNMLRNRTPTNANSANSNNNGSSSSLNASYGGLDADFGGYSSGGSSHGNGHYGSASPSPARTPGGPRRVSSRRRGVVEGEFVVASRSPVVAALLALLAATCGGLALHYRSSAAAILADLRATSRAHAADLFRTLRDDRDRWKRQVDETRRDLTRTSEQKLERVQSELSALKREKDALQEAHHKNQEEQLKKAGREAALFEQVHLLQEATKKESKRTVLEKFGEGPTYKVRMWYSLPNEKEERDFVIETAPLDVVPHAVHLFLEQVEHGLWNDCYFYLNGPHVIQAGPQLDEETDADGNVIDPEDDGDYARAVRPFADRGLDRLSFPDYSPDFPHVTWSVGFTGRPGGPDFYINKVDNVKAHGPGGQSQHALEEQGDPCFGKITEGQNNVARLYQQRVFGDGSDWTWFLAEPVKITRAVVERKATEPPKPPAEPAKTDEQRLKENDAIKLIHDRLKRKPRLPDHQVDP